MLLLRWTSAFSLLLTLIAACLLAGMRSSAFAPLDMTTSFSDGCAVGSETPCWQGIYLEQTTREQALAILRAHPWIGQIFEANASISWRWNGQQPPIYHPDQDGILRVEGDRVIQLRVRLRIGIGDVWLASGPPERVRLVRPVSLSGMYQIAYYDRAGMYFTSALNCPLPTDQFWDTDVTLGLGEIWLTETINGVELPIYQQTGWWRRLKAYCPRRR